MPGTQSSFTLPALPAGDGLANLRGHSWRVLSFEVPGFDYDSYLDSALTTSLQAYSGSETRGFVTR